MPLPALALGGLAARNIFGTISAARQRKRQRKGLRKELARRKEQLPFLQAANRRAVTGEGGRSASGGIEGGLAQRRSQIVGEQGRLRESDFLAGISQLQDAYNTAKRTNLLDNLGDVGDIAMGVGLGLDELIGETELPEGAGLAAFIPDPLMRMGLLKNLNRPRVP